MVQGQVAALPYQLALLAARRLTPKRRAVARYRYLRASVSETPYRPWERYAEWYRALNEAEGAPGVTGEEMEELWRGLEEWQASNPFFDL